MKLCSIYLLFGVGTQPFQLSRLINVCAGGSCGISGFLRPGTSFSVGVRRTGMSNTSYNTSVDISS